MKNILTTEFAAFAVFEPLLSGLIASNVKLPGSGRDVGKILSGIDEHIVIFIFDLEKKKGPDKKIYKPVP